MNPDLDVVIEDALAFTAPTINKANDKELSEMHSKKKENCDETSAYEDSYRVLTRQSKMSGLFQRKC